MSPSSVRLPGDEFLRPVRSPADALLVRSRGGGGARRPQPRLSAPRDEESIEPAPQPDPEEVQGARAKVRLSEATLGEGSEALQAQIRGLPEMADEIRG